MDLSKVPPNSTEAYMQYPKFLPSFFLFRFFVNRAPGEQYDANLISLTMPFCFHATSRTILYTLVLAYIFLVAFILTWQLISL